MRYKIATFFSENKKSIVAVSIFRILEVDFKEKFFENAEGGFVRFVCML